MKASRMVPLKCYSGTTRVILSDMNIYDDTPIVGTTIGRDQEKPTHIYSDYTYYLTKLKSNEEISNAIDRAKCLFVHEIQHVLRNEFHNEHLRLRQHVYGG